eukprot:gb/GECH01003084.1/.p1 GENE.gb/GECH01003084.1/~~gb/GECH01003084.1/.p1  ORF type:complete len:339 (+),score=56.54 gb/GECH01003084.1/:1-1017(+)
MTIPYETQIELPYDVVVHILEFLKPEEKLKSMNRVSSSWYHATLSSITDLSIISSGLSIRLDQNFSHSLIKMNRLQHFQVDSIGIGDLELEQILFHSTMMKTCKLKNVNICNPKIISRSLIYLELAECDRFEHIKHVFIPQLKTFRSLKTLIDDDSITQVLQSASKMNTLILSHCKNMKSPLQQYLSNLRVLNLEFCETLEKNILSKLSLFTPHIEVLNLEKCPYVGFHKRSLKLPHLKHLNLSQTNITSSDLEEIFQHCPRLKTVDFTRNEHLRIIKLEKLKELEKIDVSYCENLEVIESLRSDTLVEQDDAQVLTDNRNAYFHSEVHSILCISCSD